MESRDWSSDVCSSDLLDKEGKLVTGFYAARTHAIIPVEDCLLGVEENKDVLLSLIHI